MSVISVYFADLESNLMIDCIECNIMPDWEGILGDLRRRFRSTETEYGCAER